MTGNIDDRLWQFALDVYGAEGVAAECLDAQRRFDADVCLLLTSAFVASQGAWVDPATLARWNDAIRPWRENVIKPLRAVRETLKPLSVQPEIAAMRQAVLAAELQGERHALLQLGRLYAAAGLSIRADLTIERHIAETVAQAILLYTDRPFAMPRLVDAACRTGNKD